MATPSNSYHIAGTPGTAGSIVGAREDLADVIYDITPMDFPLMQAAGRSTSKAVLTEWQMHTLAAFATPDGTPNANIEGEDAVNTAPNLGQRLNNRNQIFTKVSQVTDITEVTRKAGRDDEMALEVYYRSREIKRDLEAHISQNSPIIAGTTAVAAQTGSFETWIFTNRDAVGAATTGLSSTVKQPTAGAGNKPTDSTQRPLTETIFKNVLSLGYTSGTNLPLVIAGAFNKQVIDGFAGNATPTVDAGSNLRMATYSVYVSPFGRHKIVPSRYNRARSVLFVDPEYVDLAYLEEFHTINLAITGPSRRKQLILTTALRMLNPDAHGIAADLTTS